MNLAPCSGGDPSEWDTTQQKAVFTLSRSNTKTGKTYWWDLSGVRTTKCCPKLFYNHVEKSYSPPSHCVVLHLHSMHSLQRHVVFLFICPSSLRRLCSSAEPMISLHKLFICRLKRSDLLIRRFNLTIEKISSTSAFWLSADFLLCETAVQCQVYYISMDNKLSDTYTAAVYFSRWTEGGDLVLL